MANRAKRSPDEYLNYLQQLNLAKKTQQEEELKQRAPTVTREEGFQLYFKGANDPKHRSKLKPVLRKLPKHVSTRKKWAPPISDPFEVPESAQTAGFGMSLLQRIEKLTPEQRDLLAQYILSVERRL